MVRLFQDAAWEKGQNLPLLSRKAKLAGQMLGCKNVCASFANVLWTTLGDLGLLFMEAF